MISPYVYPGVQVDPKFFHKHKTRSSFIHCTNIVCKEFKVSPMTLKLKCRERDIVAPRQLLQTLLYNLTSMTTSEVSDVFGGMNHSTITNSIKRVKMDYQTDKQFREKVNNVLFRINALHLKETLMS